jgi:hypothetical protein
LGGSTEFLQGPAAGPLGTHEELSHPRTSGGCPRWPAGLLLQWRNGGLTGYVEGRCGSVNQCHYCAVQTAHENAKMLAIQAREGDAPELLAIVGTRTPTADPKPFYNGRRLVLRALRRRWPDASYASLLEFTTGMGPRSGGLRRPHWNLFLRGIPTESVDYARELIREIWCQHVDAEPEAQYVEVVRDAAAAAKYVALHFQKESQAPPEGWRGQRFNCSRHFFPGRTVTEMRALGRAELRQDRELWRVRQEMPDLGDQEQRDAAMRALEWRDGHTWTMQATDPRRAEALLAGGTWRPPPPEARDVFAARLVERHALLALRLAQEGGDSPCPCVQLARDVGPTGPSISTSWSLSASAVASCPDPARSPSEIADGSAPPADGLTPGCT